MNRFAEARSQAIRLRTYNRPLDDEGTQFEDWDMTVERVLQHTNSLWPINKKERDYLNFLFTNLYALPAGRTLWLGGTEIATTRPASQFNCAFTTVSTVYDMVDVYWLLLQGCGVGFYPKVGTLRGFDNPIPTLEILSGSNDPDFRGRENNVETYEETTQTWMISIGDSAEAWAKSLGKILLHPFPKCQKLILDFSQIRGPGKRLSGYGWICNGAEPLITAYEKITEILNKNCGNLLNEIDILDIVNILGTVLSSRRSAQIALLPYNHSRWEAFAQAKKDYWLHESTSHRGQSNNSIIFEEKPNRVELEGIFRMLVANGGSEPGFINARSAKARAPWFVGVNPCAEILLPDKGFCNLVDINVSAFDGNFGGLLEAAYFMGRFNYRQTEVDLRDGILQPQWHQTNESLRLCGVGLCGLVNSNLTEYDLRQVRQAAIAGCRSMAEEMGTPYPKNVTTIKPGGTLPKVMGTTEGLTKPLGKYIFNDIIYAKNDPIADIMKKAGYLVYQHPDQSGSVLIRFPQEWDQITFDIDEQGREVNLESAVAQLNRYKTFMTHYADQNVSITISYCEDEIPEIIDWLLINWDYYVGVSWLPRLKPGDLAEDVSYSYLPQSVVTERVFNEYVAKLSTPDFSTICGIFDPNEETCANGSCPIR